MRLKEKNGAQWGLMSLRETTGDSWDHWGLIRFRDYWRPMGTIETQRDYWRLMRLIETTRDSWDSERLLDPVVSLRLLSLHWSHELPVISDSHESPLVSESHDSPLVSWHSSSIYESNESPVVSLSLMNPHCSPLVSPSLMSLRWSLWVSWVPIDLH